MSAQCPEILAPSDKPEQSAAAASALRTAFAANDDG
jgi:hypothetical protein